MNSRDFCYWLQGFFELNGLGKVEDVDVGLSRQQVDCIRNHLNMVFYHEIDPSFGEQDKQNDLTDIHNGKQDLLTALIEKMGRDTVIKTLQDMEMKPVDTHISPASGNGKGDITIRC